MRTFIVDKEASTIDALINLINKNPLLSCKKHMAVTFDGARELLIMACCSDNWNRVKSAGMYGSIDDRFISSFQKQITSQNKMNFNFKVKQVMSVVIFIVFTASMYGAGTVTPALLILSLMTFIMLVALLIDMSIEWLEYKLKQ